MLHRFNDYEKYLLALPVPSIDLPALAADASDIDYHERAEKVGYGTLAEYGQITSLYRVLGVVPSSVTENIHLIS